MDKLLQLWELRKEITAEMVKGQAKELIDSIWECECEVDDYRGSIRIYIGDIFEEGWGVIEFDLEDGEPLIIKGERIPNLFNVITEITPLTLDEGDWQEVWEIHTEEGYTYKVANYMDFSYLKASAHSMVTRKE